MKLICMSFGSWLVGLSVLLLVFLSGHSAVVSSNERSVTITSLVVVALLFSLAYAPLLHWLRQKLGGCRPAALFPIASALVLNLPVVVIGIFAIGRTLGPSEAFAFISAFILMGLTFGFAFVWNYYDRDIKSAKWR